MTELTVDSIRKLVETLKAEPDKYLVQPIVLYPWEAKRLGIEPSDKRYYIVGKLPEMNERKVRKPRRA